MRKNLFLTLAIVGAFFSERAIAQVDVSATGGTLTASYTTLAAAFAAVNTGVHTGVIGITLSGNTTETATASLDNSGNATSSSYTSVSIQPAAGSAITIAGNIAGPLVTLNGADNVTIDGINNGLTSLTLNNSNTGTLASTLKLINDASNNFIKNSTLKGSGTSATQGIVFVSTGTTTGNDNNVFDACNIDGTGTSISCFYASGTLSATASNSGNFVTNCNIYDFFNTASASVVGMFINTGNNDWTIAGNSFYQTVPRITGLQGVHTFLQVFPTFTTDKYSITNNFFGGNAPGAIGTATYTGSGTNVVGAIMMSIQTGGVGNLIQGNIVRNVTVNYASSAGSFGNAGIFLFIGGYNGVTTVNNNTISNLVVTNTAGAALGSGIQANGRVTTASTTVTPVFNITNNTISNLVYNSVGTATGSAQYYGIRLEASSSAALTTATTISNPTFVVTNNVINNLTTGITTGGPSGFIKGIGTVNTNGTGSTCPLWPKAAISGNTISNITTYSSLVSYGTPSSTGIHFAGSSNANNTTDVTTIQGNTIFNLNSPDITDVSNSVIGILGTNGIYQVTKNVIYGLNNSSPGLVGVPITAGINLRAVFGTTAAIANNYVSLGGSVNKGAIFGILNNFSASSPIAISNNSVYISGDATGSAKNSACIYRGNETFTASITTALTTRNNLLVNDRAGGTGSHYAIATFDVTNWTSNYNALVASNAAKIGFWNGGSLDFATWKTTSAGDISSMSAVTGLITDFTITPSVLSVADLFSNASPATTGILDVKNTNAACWLVNGKGVAISTVTTDLAGDLRNTNIGKPIDIGADEFITSTVPDNAVASAAPAVSTTTTYTYGGRKIAEITWGAAGTTPSAVAFKYYASLAPGQGTNANNTINSYNNVQVTGGSGYSYDMKLYYTDAENNALPDATMTLIKKTGASPYAFVTSTQGSDAAGKYVITSGLTLNNFELFSTATNVFPLAIKLLSFNGENKGSENNVYWNTATEENGMVFEVEQSADGKEFHKIGTVNAIGRASNYNFVDRQPYNGITYYRLNLKAATGESSYSNTIAIAMKGSNAFAVQAYPNPVADQLTIKLVGEMSEEAQVQISDVSGKLVRIFSLSTNESVIDMKGFTPGLYFVKYTDRDHSQMLKINKQ